MYRYKLVVYWSQQDESFIVDVPELPGCVSDGASYEQAVAGSPRSVPAPGDEPSATLRLTP